MNINEIKPQFYESIDYLSQEMARSHVDRNLNRLEKEIDEKLEKEEKEKKQKYRKSNKKSTKKLNKNFSNKNQIHSNENKSDFSSSFSSTESNKKSENFEIFIEPIENEKEFFSNKYSELFKKYNETKIKNENNEYINEKEKKIFEIMNNLIKENELNDENIQKLLIEKNKKITFYEKQTNKQKKFNIKMDLIRKKNENKFFAENFKKKPEINEISEKIVSIKFNNNYVPIFKRAIQIQNEKNTQFILNKKEEEKKFQIFKNNLNKKKFNNNQFENFIQNQFEWKEKIEYEKKGKEILNKIKKKENEI